ncbi:AAA family ATPase [Burkholderia sp. LMG 21824]|uniref:AAA family ATPase n=1 Tax=Burkholderia sp. LMG 21824 TaxID=3158172 RepID=UPI003C2DA85F
MNQVNDLRIESLVLKGVGVFDDTRIDFSSKPDGSGKAEVHLFTGPNGCGKSTLLYALAGIFDGMNGAGLVRRRYLSTASTVSYKSSRSYGQYGAQRPNAGDKADEQNTFSSEFGPVSLWYNDVSQGVYGAIDRADFPTNNEITNIPSYKQLHAGYNHATGLSATTFPFAAFAYSGQRTLTQVSIGAIADVSVAPLENALSFDFTARPQIMVQWIANNRAMAAMAKADGEDAAAAAYDLSLTRITDAVRDICDLDVRFKVTRSPLAVAVVVGGVQTPFDALPDGLKSVVSWIADLTIRLEAIPWEDRSIDIFSQRIFLFLDEVDVHLHPRWQRRILPAVQRLLPNAQIFVSTHSPFVVGSVDEAWIYRLPERGKQRERVIKPLPSGAGKSYRLILDEIFGIEQEFDVETERMFDEFYAERDQFLRQRASSDQLLGAATRLAERSEEARTIVETELRQISRRSGVEVRLA